MNRITQVGVALRESWQRLAVVGTITILLGVLSIVSSFAVTLTTVFVLGGILLCGGILHAIQVFSAPGREAVLRHVLAAVLYGVSGGFMLTHPIAGSASLTLLVGMLLVIGGLYQSITALVLRNKNWGWECLNGVISLFLGASIFSVWPFSSFWLIGTFIGIDLICRGWSSLTLALLVRAAMEPVRAIQEERRAGPMDRRLAVTA